MRAKVRFPIGPMRAKVRPKRGQRSPSRGGARRFGPHCSNSAFNRRFCRFNRRFNGRCHLARTRPHSTGLVRCGQRGSTSTGRCDAWSKRRLKRRFGLCGSVGGSARFRGRMARLLGPSPTGPSGRIARGPRVESHLVNTRCNRRIPLGPRVESRCVNRRLNRRIPLGPLVESHWVNRRLNRRIPLGPRVESHWVLGSNPTGSKGD